VGGGGFHVKAGALRLGRHYFAAKVNGNFPSNPARGLPTIQGLAVLSDADDGTPLCVMQSGELTRRRTAAATAVAARYLARPDSATLTIIGCGAQAVCQVEAVTAVLPIRTVHTVDREPGRAAAAAAQLTRTLGVDARPVAHPRQVLNESDVIVTCTTSRAPLLSLQDVPAGAFVAAVGADHPDKNEIAADLMAAATVVVDVLEQAAAFGDLRHALAAGVLTRERVHAELGAIVAGTRRGRGSPEERIVFDSTGMALQDVAAAALVYEAVTRP
jgi:ornithine cyclodeaminase/alanine dehydrogenase-like protein (mu-crystallin family)